MTRVEVNFLFRLHTTNSLFLNKILQFFLTHWYENLSFKSFSDQTQIVMRRISAKEQVDSPSIFTRFFHFHSIVQFSTAGSLSNIFFGILCQLKSSGVLCNCMIIYRKCSCTLHDTLHENISLE